MRSLIAIASVADAPSVNALLFALDPNWGDGNLSRELSPTGAAPATHLCCCLAEPTDDFLALLASAQAGGVSAPGFPAADVQALLSRVVIDIATDIGPYAHWTAVLAAQGLTTIESAA